MRNDFYPPGSVRALLNTDSVTPQTRDILNGRLQKKEIINPCFFNKEMFVTLRHICERLIPQPNRLHKVDLPGFLDEMLFKGEGNGWRYNQMPPDNEAFIKGMQGIEETSKLMFDAPFILLDITNQDKVLHSIQKDLAPGKTWQTIPSNLFFEELLAQLVEIYYSHPQAKEEIGEVAMADANGWQKIGLNELEPREPKALNK
ncbi:MAG: gluconate 2-dehydrogenase subunit 3 family protein [Chitinophagales bacterium]|nr:gluconate 2-dehydrogenase subunit 3 family protein [Chitinophagales bacterium]